MYQNELVDRRNHENSLAEFKVSFVLCYVCTQSTPIVLNIGVFH